MTKQCQDGIFDRDQTPFNGEGGVFKGKTSSSSLISLISVVDYLSASSSLFCNRTYISECGRDSNNNINYLLKDYAYWTINANALDDMSVHAIAPLELTFIYDEGEENFFLNDEYGDIISLSYSTINKAIKYDACDSSSKSLFITQEVSYNITLENYMKSRAFFFFFIILHLMCLY